MDFLYWENLQDIVVPKGIAKGTVTNAAILKENILVVADRNIYWVQKKSGVNKGIKFGSIVNLIACNNSVALILADGLVWAIGNDERRSGLLGAENLNKAEQPVQVSCLLRNIVKIAIGPTHAACIDNEGILYTWGTGPNGELGDLNLTHSSPQQVPNSSFFKSTDVTCSPSSTSVCTEAGFLFIFGQKKTCPHCSKSRNSYPLTIKSLSEDFITKLTSISDSILIQTDKQEVKIISSCFCVQIIGCKGKVSEFVSFDNGAVGISADKNILYLIKKQKTEWTCENFLVVSGSINRIVGSVDRNVGIIGKGINVKSLKKVNEVCSGDSSLSTSERVSFDEIVQSLGFKGKIPQIHQKGIFDCIEKFALRQCLEAFRCLKKCKLQKEKVFINLSSKFLVKSVEKFWNIWRSINSGYKQGKNVNNERMKVLQSKFLSTYVNKVYKSFVQRQYFTVFSTVKKMVPKNSVLLFSLLKCAQVKKQQLNLFRAFNTLRRNNIKKLPVNKPLFIDPSYKIEILPPDDDKDMLQTLSPVRINSFLSDGDLQIKSSSMKILNNSASPLIDNLSSNSETSPNLKTTKDDSSLRSQISKKLGERNSLNIKLGAHVDKNVPKTPAARKGFIDNKKHLSNKEPETPKLFGRNLTDGNLKRRSVGIYDKFAPGEYLRQSLQILMNKCIKRRFNEILNRLKDKNSLGSGSKSVGFCSSPSNQSIAGSWKNKLFALGFNKFIKSLTGILKKTEQTSFFLIRNCEKHN